MERKACEVVFEALNSDLPIKPTALAATKHVINSKNGSPWTAEEEKHRQEKLKKLAPVPENK